MHALRLSCSPDEVDAVSGELWETGTEGIQELDRGDGVELIAGFADESRGPELLAKFSGYEPNWTKQPETDWVLETQAAWPPRETGTRLFLAPPWFTGQTPPGRVRVSHNPGMASGTGEHPCTQLVLEAVEDSVFPGARVVDIGTGSGVVAIAAAKLGATLFAGIDTDADALHTARENFMLNQLPPVLAAGSPDCLASECAEIVVANISGSVLLAIFDDLLRISRDYLILSGFTEYELPPFLDLLPGAKVTSRNEWRCVCARVSSPAPVGPN